MTKAASNLEKSPARHLKKLYAATIGVVAIITFSEQFLIQRSLHSQKENTHVINIAGRQRMLSQKISKAALGLRESKTLADRRAYFQELQEATALWSKSHEGLQAGDTELDLTGQNSDQVASMYAALEPHYQTMFDAAQTLLDAGISSVDTDQVQAALETLLDNEADFLKQMNAIVFQYDSEAQGQAARLNLIQFILLGGMLTMLLPLFFPIQTITYRVNALIRRMQESGIQVTASTTQIAASGKQLEAMVTEQLATTQEVSTTAQEIATTATDLAATMEQVAGLAHATAHAATDEQAALYRMEETLGQLAQATSSIASKLGIISERANNVNTVVTTITKVADQTNLLSLNAAIEAEKAGEYGTGFSVVAREIRRLADQTAVATLEIEGMVKDMQAAVANGVMEMDKFSQDVVLGVEDIRKINDQTVQMIEQVQGLTPRFETVNQGVDTQAQSALQIGAAIRQLSEAAQQTAQSIRDTNYALERLNQTATSLQG
ncbi:MAG: methyl-accepting chemotaxis protein [Cyanobacteria bacterium J06635_1]